MAPTVFARVFWADPQKTAIIGVTGDGDHYCIGLAEPGGRDSGQMPVTAEPESVEAMN